MFLTIALLLMAVCVLGMLIALWGLIFSSHRAKRPHRVMTDTSSLSAVTKGPDGILHLKGLK